MKDILDFGEGIYTVNGDAFGDDNVQHPVNQNTKPVREKCINIPRRYLVVLLGFLIFAILNAQRVNMVIALVAMTNATNATESTGRECLSSTGRNSTKYPIDRGTFDWNAEVQGYIVGSSFLGFVLTLAIGGRLAETLGPKQILISSVSFASVCNLLSPVCATWNPYMLAAIQFLRGMAQGFMQPAVSCLMVRWFPKPERGFLSSFTISGFPVGLLFGGIISGALCDTNFLGGWPSVFYIFGLSGIILVMFLAIYMHNFPAEDGTITDAELKYILSNQEISSGLKSMPIPWLKMLLSVPTWALLAGMFGQFWMAYYFISVHPSYLANVLHFNVMESGVFSSLPYILQIFFPWIASYTSDCLVQRKFASTDTARKTCNTLSCLGFSLSLLGAAYSGCNVILNTACFFVAMGSIGFGFPGALIVAMDMTVQFAGTLWGLSSTFASTTGFIIPVMVGQLTNGQQTLSQWHKIFLISAAVVMGSGVIFHCFGSATLQDWETSGESGKETTQDENSFAICGKENMQKKEGTTITKF